MHDYLSGKGIDTENMQITKNQKNILACTILVFLLLKILLSVWPWFDSSTSGTDFSTYRQWSLQLVNHGFNKFYETAQYFPYPPLSNYFFWSLGMITKIFNQPINGMLMTVLFKLPNIISELAVGFFLFVLARKKNTFKISYTMMLFFLFQPAMTFISSVWGQWDGLMLFFLFLSFYCLYEGKTVFGLILLICSILVKPQAFPFIIPLAVLGFKNGGYRKFLIGGLTALIFLLLLFLPFFPSDPLRGAYSYFKSNLSSFAPRFTSSGFNFWYLFYGGWRDDFPMLFGISVRVWTRILAMGFIILCSGFIFFKKTIKDHALAVGLCGFSFFLFFTQMKERYMYAVMPFVILGLLSERKRISTIVALTISLLFCVNTIGFYVGWIGFGLWNSTFLSYYYLDKIISILYILAYLYILFLLFKKERGKQPVC